MHNSSLLRCLILLLLSFGVWGLSRYGQSLPPPLGLDAPPSLFSAARADATLARILGPEKSRFVGSAENAAARTRILSEMEHLGLRSELQTKFLCNGTRMARSIRCATVTNIIGHAIEGAGPALVLMAHYDSVWAGPGASDDGSGVATILETVRAIKAAKLTAKHPVLVLFTDGEEAGLFGARAFLQDPEWRSRVGTVINVEARGTQGQSLLFQTSPGDSAFISLYAENVRHYATSSLFALIYRLLPNDTDLTPFLAAGIPGVNFAFIEGAYRYHTPLDRRAFLDPVTLQQHGENVLGMARGILQADFSTLSGRDDGIYLTVLGRWLPRLSARWALPLSLLLFAGTIAAVFFRREAQITRRAWLQSLAVAPLLLLGVVAAGFLLHTLAAQISGNSAPANAHALPMRLTLAMGVAAAVLWIARLWSTRVPDAVIWLWPVLFGALTAGVLPGLSPYFLFPALIAVPLLLAARFLPLRPLLVALAAVPALIVWLGFNAQGEGVMGLMLHPLFTVTAAFAVLGFVPLLRLETLPRKTWIVTASAMSLAALIGATVAGLQPAFSPQIPQRLNLSYVEDYTKGQALWAADALTPGLRDALTFSPAPQASLPLNVLRNFLADAGRPHLDLPDLEIQSDKREPSGRVVDVSLSGSAQAAALTLVVPAAAKPRFASINGREMATPPDGDIAITCLGRDCNGAHIVLTLGSTAAFDLLFAEQRQGLPPEGHRLIAARGDSAVPSQTGDLTVLIAKRTIP